jgi:hypothetical protein
MMTFTVIAGSLMYEGIEVVEDIKFISEPFDNMDQAAHELAKHKSHMFSRVDVRMTGDGLTPRLIALIKAHTKLGCVAYTKMSDKDISIMTESRELIRASVLALAGMPDASLADVMAAFDIPDNLIWGK